MKVLNVLILLVFTATLTGLTGERAESSQRTSSSSSVRVALLPVMSRSVESVITTSTTSVLKEAFRKYGEHFELSYAPGAYDFGHKFNPQIYDTDSVQFFPYNQFDVKKLIADTAHLDVDVVLLYKFEDKNTTNFTEDILMKATIYMVNLKTHQVYSVNGDVDGTSYNDNGEADIKTVTEQLFEQYLLRNQSISESRPVKSGAEHKGQIRLEYNSQRPGGDYIQFVTDNARECARECEKSRRCQAFDFYESDKSCWLKSAAYSARYYNGVISGFKRSNFPPKPATQTVHTTGMKLDHDTQRPGGDYTRFRAQNGKQCAKKCSQDPRCTAFDFTSSDSFCYLKSWQPPARQYRGIISGIKVKRRYFPQIKSVQKSLIEKNYNPGIADGVMGKKTRFALKNYQRDHNLPVTGTINDATLVSLGLLQGVKAVTQSSPTADKVISIQTIGVTYLQIADNIYADIVAKIPADTELKVLLQIGEWYKVSYRNQVGYVLAEAVRQL